MNPNQIRNAYYRKAMTFPYAIRMLMQIGFGQMAAEEYLYTEGRA